MTVTKMDQQVMSRMILVDFALLDMPNPTIAGNQMKDFTTTLTGLPPFQVENQIVQLHKQFVTQAVRIGDAQE
jgi:hypothetical protein